jgi:PST family polysaccharide transporter
VRRQQSFVQGAMLLAGAAMLSKLLGSVYTIVLQNIIGDHGMGLFQMAYPIYATLLAIATAGFPVAVSKLVAEELARGHTLGARRAFQLSALFLSSAGVVTFFILYLWAPEWAQLAGDPAATLAIRAISPALLFVPILSAVRGYLQGFEWMAPTAVSQVVEQFVRVATIIGLAIYLIQSGYGTRAAAAGAAFGAVTGAGAGLLVLLYFWRQKASLEPTERVGSLSTPRLLGRLLYYAFPISLGALVVPLMNNVDVLTVVHLLKQSGVSQRAATTAFGLLAGRASKLTMLPITLAAGIGIAVIPAVSAAAARGDHDRVRSQVASAVRLTTMIALPAAIGMTLLARPIDVVLFENVDGWTIIAVLSASVLFASLQTTTSAVLQGAGMVYLPVVYMVLAALLKVVLNLFWVPRFGLVGAALATDVAYALAAYLNIRAVIQRIPGVSFRSLALPQVTMASVVMGGGVFALVRGWGLLRDSVAGRLAIGGGTVIALAVGILLYGLAVTASGALTSEEIERIPRVGPTCVRWLQRLGLTQ